MSGLYRKVDMLFVHDLKNVGGIEVKDINEFIK